MPERKVELRQFGIFYLCDSCGEQCSYTGERSCSKDPDEEPLFINKCTSPKCGIAYALPQAYPRQLLVPKEEQTLIISPFRGNG